ncbi:MAG: hypothetical protein HUJ26_02800 [Planctomycetaceae bacterium]|nr:hypothetical protein [Planctomycetaceae bacterium]
MVRQRTKQKTSASENPSPHDVYAIRCYCGHQITGERSDSSQTISCPECDEKLYVMARDVYPRPAILNRQNPVEDSQEATSPSKTPDLQVVDIPDDERLAEPVNDTPPRVWIDEPKGRRIRTRILQLAGMIALLMVLTFWALSSRKSRGEYEEIFLTQSTAAWEHLLANEWDDAQVSAEASVLAADRLGRQDDAAIALRHLSEELSILDQLSSYSLIEVTQGLEELKEESAAGKWDELFRARFAGRWHLLQATIIRENTEEKPIYWLEAPINLPDQTVKMRWEEPVAWFEELDWKDNQCEVFLAVELSDLQQKQSRDHEWTIVLSSEHAKLWRTPLLLEQMYGYPISESTEDPFASLVLSQSLQPDDLIDLQEETP